MSINLNETPVSYVDLKSTQEGLQVEDHIIILTTILLKMSGDTINNKLLGNKYKPRLSQANGPYGSIHSNWKNISSST